MAKIEMNIHVAAGTNAPQSEDVFGVVIHVFKGKMNATLMDLVHYERISTYAVYDKCRDAGVDGDICICSLTDQETGDNQRRIVQYWHKTPQTAFNHPATVVSLNECVFLYERRTHYGLVVETSCDCSNNKTFVLKLVINNQINVVHSSLPPVVTNLRAGMMVFVAAFYQRDHQRAWVLDYDVEFQEVS